MFVTVVRDACGTRRGTCLMTRHHRRSPRRRWRTQTVTVTQTDRTLAHSGVCDHPSFLPKHPSTSPFSTAPTRRSVDRRTFRAFRPPPPTLSRDRCTRGRSPRRKGGRPTSGEEPHRPCHDGLRAEGSVQRRQRLRLQRHL